MAAARILLYAFRYCNKPDRYNIMPRTYSLPPHKLCAERDTNSRPVVYDGTVTCARLILVFSNILVYTIIMYIIIRTMSTGAPLFRPRVQENL